MGKYICMHEPCWEKLKIWDWMNFPIFGMGSSGTSDHCWEFLKVSGGKFMDEDRGWLLCSNMPRLIWCLFQYNDRIDWSNFIGWELFHAADGQNIVNIQYIVLKEMMISTLQAVICMGHKAWAYLIFVNSINSGASVNKLTEGILFHN